MKAKVYNLTTLRAKANTVAAKSEIGQNQRESLLNEMTETATDYAVHSKAMEQNLWACLQAMQSQQDFRPALKKSIEAMRKIVKAENRMAALMDGAAHKIDWERILKDIKGE